MWWTWRPDLYIVPTMRRRLRVHPVLLLPGHSLASGHPSSGPRSIKSTTLRTVAEGLESPPRKARLPLVDDHLDGHAAAPDTGRVFRFVCSGIESPMTAGSVSRQFRRGALPGWWRWPSIDRALLRAQAADLVVVHGLGFGAGDRMRRALDFISYAQRVLGFSGDANADGECAFAAPDCPSNSKGVAQVAVRTLIEGPSQANAWLNRDDLPSPDEFAVLVGRTA